MTALLLYAKCQVVRTLRSPRRLNVLLTLMLAITALGLVLLFQVAPSATVSYEGSALIMPIRGDLCPGEPLVYQQSIHVENTDMVDISREWCNQNGTCNLDLHQSWENVVLTPLDFSGTVTRTVPVSPLFKPGGLYEFRSGVRDGKLDVQIIPFSIRGDCEAKP